MELALNLGMTADVMLQSMTAAELDHWATHAQRYLLPHKRVEIMLAQVCSLIAKTRGGAKEVTVRDFMLQIPSDDLPQNVTRLDLARKAFGFKPIKPKA